MGDLVEVVEGVESLLQGAERGDFDTGEDFDLEVIGCRTIRQGKHGLVDGYDLLGHVHLSVIPENGVEDVYKVGVDLAQMQDHTCDCLESFGARDIACREGGEGGRGRRRRERNVSAARYGAIVRKRSVRDALTSQEMALSEQAIRVHGVKDLLEVLRVHSHSAPSAVPWMSKRSCKRCSDQWKV